MIFLSTKRFNDIMTRLEALEDAVTTPAPKKKLNGKQGGALYMHEAIRKIMSDGKPRNSKQLAKEINKAALTKIKARPGVLVVRMATLAKKKQLIKLARGIYQGAIQ